MPRRTLAVSAVAAVAATLVATNGTAVAEQVPCPGPTEQMLFTSDYIDTERAGGEPIVTTHPDGGLLWGSHAGTTHFYTPAAADGTTSAFVENYEGQTYQYRSEDGGIRWDFVPRTPISTVDPTSGLPNSGFSDPEFAIDKAGNVYISEINLANIAISRSSDAGRSYTLQSLAEITLTDRQWMEADEENVLWFVGNTFGGGSTSSGNAVTGSVGTHELYKSTDGGVTFSAPQPMGGQQSSDIEIDKTDGRLYELHSERDRLTLWIAPDAREQTPPEVGFLNRDGTTTAPNPEDPPVIAEHYNRKSSIGPTIDIDPWGNLYVVWDDDGTVADDGRVLREPGIHLAMSSDRGETWTEPVKLDRGEGTAFWPWIAAGEHGAVAVWLQHDGPVAGNEPQNARGDWYVMASQIERCETRAKGPKKPATTVWSPPSTPVRASHDSVHTGTICTGGTFCQARAIDRRLGDYFANAIDREGNVYISVSDTRQGGGVSLPLVIRQIAGPTVGDPYANDEIWGDALGYDDGATTDDATPAETCASGFAGALRSVGSFLGLASRC
ncbi:MAG: hypothetical protein KY457_00530 [Actinobacteria bacterium]|nr:hypothetical protein [Actinomycetota bacterium]